MKATILWVNCFQIEISYRDEPGNVANIPLRTLWFTFAAYLNSKRTPELRTCSNSLTGLLGTSKEDQLIHRTIWGHVPFSSLTCLMCSSRIAAWRSNTDLGVHICYFLEHIISKWISLSY